jgi:hypothetical protein
MSPHHHYKQMSGPYFGSDHYEETHEAELERKIEAKWHSIKDFVKRLFKPFNKR